MLLYQKVYAQLQGGAPASFPGHDLVGSRATSLLYIEHNPGLRKYQSGILTN